MTMADVYIAMASTAPIFWMLESLRTDRPYPFPFSSTFEVWLMGVFLWPIALHDYLWQGRYKI